MAREATVNDNPYNNVLVKMAAEHFQMRQMVQNLLGGLITPAAFVEKHKNFSCDTETEIFADKIVEFANRQAESRRTRH